MKTKLLILAGLLVILGCLVAAVAVSQNRTDPAAVNRDSAVKSLQAQLHKTQDQMKLHDAVNNDAIKNAGDQIILLTNQKNTICTQVKAAKLVQPLCP